MFAEYKQRGDTIIEVLIAIAVAASVLGIVFATSARNLRAIRDIQERSEATRLIQGQIEALRYLYSTSPSTMPVAGAVFCMNGPLPVSGFTGSVPNPTLLSEDFSKYPPGCKTTDKLYNYAIVGDATGTYKFYARWDSLTPSGRDQIIMAYKVN
jgi:prepilin-type N-terminal cleavage/methylation domain-containing protein